MFKAFVAARNLETAREDDGSHNEALTLMTAETWGELALLRLHIVDSDVELALL